MGLAVIGESKLDFIFGVTPGDIVWDIETYPNTFTLTAKHKTIKKVWKFEISPRRDDSAAIRCWIDTLRNETCRMVGFNSLGFDYPVLHYFYNYEACTVEDIYAKVMSIIKGSDENRFKHMIWDNQRIVPQIDLFKIHHFDNKARSTGLKVLEFNMRMESIEDLPFPLGIDLTPAQVEVLVHYNEHDVDATMLFLAESQEHIEFREKLSAKYNRNFMNHNDTKIGKDYFIMKLEEHDPLSCYYIENGKRTMRQTLRTSIAIADVILPYIKFDHPEFTRILNWFNQQVIIETKGVFTDVSCSINGFQFDFGTGGIHGSVDSQIVLADNDNILVDIDVTSFYPKLAIVNKFYPEHLSEKFCEIYEDVFKQRQTFAKGTVENAMLKLALNGVYGDSNNPYSPFFDAKYTMAITINGQLLLCMLAEALMKNSQLTMIQANTDGITVKIPRDHKPWLMSVCTWWEQLTNLTLESVEYKAMYIRDVNNYLAVGIDGKIKRKGTYEYKMQWHQDHSMIVVAKAAEAALIHDADIREFIEAHEDKMDFMLRAKVPRSCILEHGGEQVGNIVRYYVSNSGDWLEKITPAKGVLGHYKQARGVSDDDYARADNGVWDERLHTKNRSVHEESRTRIHQMHTVRLCNDMSKVTEYDINFDFYVAEAEKLVLPLLGRKR